MPYTSENLENILSAIVSLQESLRRNMKSTAEICCGASALLSEYQSAVEKIIQFQNSQKTIAALTSVIDGFTTSIGSMSVENQSQEVPVLNYEKIKGTLERVEPYVEKVEETEEKKSVLGKLRKRMSPEMIIGIIGILVQIVLYIMSSMPDEQLDKIIEQNNAGISQGSVLVSQSKEIIEEIEINNELARDENDLLGQIAETIRDLSYSLDVLTEQMGEPSEDVDNVISQ